MNRADRIRQARTEASMSQPELADKLGCSPQKVSSWEKDTRAISFSDLIRLADATGARLSWLLGDPESNDGHAITAEAASFVCSETGLSARRLVEAYA